MTYAPGFLMQFTNVKLKKKKKEIIKKAVLVDI